MQENYLVLARKYRPMNFAHLRGQDFMVTTIINAIKLGRVAHAFLLTGIRGGGKTTTARIIARTLNCSNPVTEESLVLPCGTCNNCLSSLGDKHPDIIELDAASRTGVDDMREIIENSSYSPLMGKYKIYIIDEVHMLSTSAFNALLKTLEEPPSHVKFIFATTELRKIPITILSRCQKFELRRLNSQELVAHLQDILEKEKIKAEIEALELIALHAEGSVRDSLSLLDLIIANADNQEITLTQVKNLLGIGDESQIIMLLEAIVNGNSKASIEQIKEFYYAGKDLSFILQQLMELIHNISKAKLNILVAKDPQINNLAASLNISTLTILWQMIVKSLQELQNTHNQLIYTEMLMIRLCHLSNIPTPADLVKQINETTPSPSEATQATAKKTLASFEELVQLFYQHREMLIYEYLTNDVQLVEFSPPRLKLKLLPSVPHNFTNKLAAMLKEYTGEKWTILASQEGEAAPTLSTQADEAKAEKIAESSKNEIAQEILKNFSQSYVKDVS